MSDCKHTRIRSWQDAETKKPVPLWSCVDCGHKFEPVNLERDADAERYRWLRSQPLDDPEIWIAVDSVSVPGRWALGGDDPDGCDAAIDAAMGKAKICHYPDCVDKGPDGKCTAWLIGDCEGPKHD